MNTYDPRDYRTLLAAIAEFERSLIGERTGEGRKRALAILGAGTRCTPRSREQGCCGLEKCVYEVTQASKSDGRTAR